MTPKTLTTTSKERVAQRVKELVERGSIVTVKFPDSDPVQFMPGAVAVVDRQDQGALCLLVFAGVFPEDQHHVHEVKPLAMVEYVMPDELIQPNALRLLGYDGLTYELAEIEDEEGLPELWKEWSDHLAANADELDHLKEWALNAVSLDVQEEALL